MIVDRDGMLPKRDARAKDRQTATEEQKLWKIELYQTAKRSDYIAR